MPVNSQFPTIGNSAFVPNSNPISVIQNGGLLPARVIDISLVTSTETLIIIIFAIYKEAPFTIKAKTIKPGMTKSKFFFCSINNCLIAGSSKYATEEVLPANNNVKKTESIIFFTYFLV